MSLDPPAFLAQLQSNIRQRPIPWDGAVRSGTITEQQLSLIRAVDKAKKPEARVEMVNSDMDGYRSLFIGNSGQPSILKSATKQTNVVQYILVLLGDLLDGVPQLAKFLLRNPDPYKDFLPLLAHSNNAEDPIPLLASTALTKIMSSSRDESDSTSHAMPILFTYLTGLAKSSDAGLQDIAVQQYSSLLYGKFSRQQFWAQRSETVAPLVNILQTACGIGNGTSSASLWSGSTGLRSTGFEGSMSVGVGLQLLYHVLLVMWQMSFEAEEIGDELNNEYDFIVVYTQLLRLSQKEKTTRLIVSTLVNLLEKNEKTLLPAATLARLPALVQTLSARHLTDQDLVEDLAKLKDMLEEYSRTKTNFDEYVAEVESGHLRWSPPHRSQVFWAENARKILDYENGSIARKLAQIMQKPWDNDKQVLAIACNDIGCLVREVPEKRPQLEKFGLKTRVMELMQDSDENVRWESLRALGGWLKYSFDG